MIEKKRKELQKKYRIDLSRTLLGEIALKSDDSEYVLIVTDIWDGEEYIDVRKWVSTPDYNGYTKKGIKLKLLQWEDTINIIREYLEEEH